MKLAGCKQLDRLRISDKFPKLLSPPPKVSVPYHSSTNSQGRRIGEREDDDDDEGEGDTHTHVLLDDPTKQECLYGSGQAKFSNKNEENENGVGVFNFVSI